MFSIIGQVVKNAGVTGFHVYYKLACLLIYADVNKLNNLAEVHFVINFLYIIIIVQNAIDAIIFYIFSVFFSGAKIEGRVY